MSNNAEISPRIAAVVVTYNGAEWLEACLDSLIGGSVEVQVFVVDNGSTDDSRAIAAAYPNVTLMPLGRNLGFGRATNLGIEKALANSADYVFLCNQDAEVEADTIEVLLRVARADPTIGIACPMQLDGGGMAIDRSFLEYYLVRHAPKVIDDAYLGCLEESYDASEAPAAAWMLTRRLLKNVGGFDPLFFMYCEDDDLCRRARHHRFKVKIVAAARFRHSRGFHAAVMSETASQRLARKAARLRATLVRDAKSPSGSCLKNAWHSSVQCLMQGLSDAIAHLDGISLLASLIAIGRTWCEIPRIYAHRRTSLQEGAHWLTAGDDSEGVAGK